ncbi:O-antigen ligase family protein [Paraglaciecola aquimarina]|uniref:O-antigen ligase family protein n=1 Tax=Paraglaciecola aquimarina TaxID=1235557 RepID=A0ABU3T178_9ALTE|nr:O-antigen ligase family protein [Paraglaciecola aquimarina]MDU0356006.1 O-antigen ligase family protein [Paraglaciecola aquimarina]
MFASLQVIPLPEFMVNLLSPKAHFPSDSQYMYLSSDIGQSKVSLLKSFAYFCLFLCSLILINNEKRVKQVLTLMLIVGSLQGLYGILEILLGTEFSLIFNLPIAESATGSFVYRNHFANFIMLCLSAGTGLILASINNNQSMSGRDWTRAIVSSLLGNKALIRICLAIMVIALVMSRSRMGNSAFFIALTLVSIYALVVDRKRSKGLSILVVSMIIIDLVIVSSWFGLDKVQERLAETSLAKEGRDEVVIDASVIIADYPLMGTGGGSFYSVFPSYKKANVYPFYDQAHNDYLQMLIEYGLLGFSCLAAIVLLCFLVAVAVIKKRKNAMYKGAAFASLMAITGMLIHMSVDFPLQAPANASYFVVFLALALLSKFNLSAKPYSSKSGRMNHGH